VFLRIALVAVILLPLAAHRGVLGAAWHRLGWILAFGVAEFGVPWLLMVVSEEKLSSSLTALLIAAVPATTAVLYRFTGLREHLGPKRALGLLIGLAGVALLVGLSTTGSTWTSLLLMIGVVLGYAIGTVIVDRRLAGLSGIAVVGIAATAIAIAYAPLGIAELPHHLSTGVLVSFLLLALVCSVGSYLTAFALIVEVGAPRSAVVTYINPAVAIVAGAVVLGEPITLAMVLGFPLVIIGSVLATAKAHEGGGPREPVEH